MNSTPRFFIITWSNSSLGKGVVEMGTVILDSFTVTLALTSVMLLLMIVIYAIVLSIRRARTSQFSEEMYIGGEGEDILSLKVPSVLALYWGIIRRSWRRAFDILRGAVHSGVLNEWYSYMNIWLSLLILLSIIAIVMSVRIR